MSLSADYRRSLRRAAVAMAGACALVVLGASPGLAAPAPVQAGSPAAKPPAIVWHVVNADGSLGPTLAQVEAKRRATGRARPDALPPDDSCPPNTHYTGTKAIYSCENVFPDNIGYQVGLRTGRETITIPRLGDDGDADESKGFGRVHAQEDHNVGPHSIALIVADAPPEPGKEPRHPTRYLYSIAGVQGPEAMIVEVLNVVVQKSPDTTGNAPDKDDFGVITAYCSVGDPGAAARGFPGYCSSALRPPFNGGAAN